MPSCKGVVFGVLGLLITQVWAAGPTEQVFFDDFSYRSSTELAHGGWKARSKNGHPGVEGAAWREDALSVVEDPKQSGNTLLRLTAKSNGAGAGTVQAQLCHERKYLEGTYAARVRFSDAPTLGVDGDPIIQTFYAVSPLKHDFDPQFSEIDWEYLPNGGWGSDKTRLYGITWQTVRLEPWQSFNQSHEEFRHFDGWHVLMMQVANGKVRWFVDGEPTDEHGGRNYPVVPMSINFSLWFAPVGLLPANHGERVYEQDVDWVYHVRGAVQTFSEVNAAVQALRDQQVTRVDKVPAMQPALASTCDF